MFDEASQGDVVFVLNRLARGGMERMTLTLAGELRRRGRFRPVIACLAEPGELANEALAAGIDLHAGLLRGKFDFKAVRRLGRILAGEPALWADARGHDGRPAGLTAASGKPRRRPVAAAVIVNPAGDRMFWTCLARGRRQLGRPDQPALVLWTHRSPQPGRRIIEPINRLFVGRLDAVAVLGPRLAEAYARIEHLPAERMHVVVNGLAGERIARLGDRSGRDELRAALGAGPRDVVVMCVANPRPVKRVDLFCQAAATALSRRPGRLRFWLAGEAGRDARAAGLIEMLKLRLPDFVPLGRRDDLDRLWPAADIGVCCSDSEALSVSMLEAMAAGCAFVSTAVGEHPTLIEPGGTGLLIPTGSADALADAVVRLADDAELRDRLGQAARQLVAQQYTAERMTDQFEALLDRIRQPGRADGR